MTDSRHAAPRLKTGLRSRLTVRLSPVVRIAGTLLLVTISALSEGRREVIEALTAGQHQRAVELLEALLEQDPNDHALLTLRGIALNRIGRPEEALASYRTALERAPEYLAALQGAAEIEFQRRDPKARSRLEKAIAIHAQNPTAHAMLGVLAFERDECPAAVVHFARAGPALSNSGQVLSQYGQCAFQEGESQTATDVFRQLLDLEPTNSAARFNLSVSLFRAGRYGEAIDTVHPLVGVERPESEALSLLADAYLSNKQVPEALETLKRAVAIHPRNERHYVDLANLCMEQEAHDLGFEILDAGIMNIPGSARLHSMRGVLLAQLSQFERAEAEFARATELEPGQVSGRIGLSIALQQTGRHAEAIPILREQADAEPDNPVVNTMLGRALLQNAEAGAVLLDEARAALERAVQADPTQTTAWVELGKLFMKTGQLREAITMLDRAVATAPDDRQAVYQLMLVSRKSGQLEKTRELSQRLRAMVVRDQREDTRQARFQLVREDSEDP